MPSRWWSCRSTSSKRLPTGSQRVSSMTRSDSRRRWRWGVVCWRRQRRRRRWPASARHEAAESTRDRFVVAAPAPRHLGQALGGAHDQPGAIVLNLPHRARVVNQVAADRRLVADHRRRRPHRPCHPTPPCPRQQIPRGARVPWMPLAWPITTVEYGTFEPSASHYRELRKHMCLLLRRVRIHVGPRPLVT